MLKIILLVGLLILATSNHNDSYRYDHGFKINVKPNTPVNKYVELPSGNNKLYNLDTVSILNSQGEFKIPPNFRPHPTTARHQLETDIAIHPHDPDIMFGSAITYNVGGVTGFSCGHYVTTDGGVTWFGDDTTVANYGDPAPIIDKDGKLLIGFITQMGRVGTSYSTNNGFSWSSALDIPGSKTSSDKEFMATDGDSLSPYYGRSYMLYSELDSGKIFSSYSTNNGFSWTPKIKVSDPTRTPPHFNIGVDVTTYNGTVYAVWANSVINSQNSTEDSLGFSKSTDGGNSWISVTNQAANMNGIRTSSLINGIRANGLPRIDTDSQGNLYVVTTEKNFSPALDNADIVLMKSTNQGSTWSRVRVNQNPAGSYEYFSVVDIDEYGGINVCYFSTRNTSTNDSVEVYLSRSTDGGITFIDMKVSDHKTKPEPIGSIAAGYSGDYIGLVTGNGRIVPFWYERGEISGGRYQAFSSIIEFVPRVTISLIPEGFYNNGTLRMKDTVSIFVRNSEKPYNLVDSESVIIDSLDFHVTPVLDVNPFNDYYVVVKHRNTLETWSVVTSLNNYNYNFTTAANQAYGDNQVLIASNPKQYAVYSGDVNQDGFIDLKDGLIIYGDVVNYETGYVNTDLTGDKTVDLSDLYLGYNNILNQVSIQRP